MPNESAIRKLMPTVTTKIVTEVSFYLGQALTSHGCFSSCGHKIWIKIDSPICPCGEGNETSEHVFLHSTRFTTGRPPPMLKVTEAATCKYLEAVVIELWKIENEPQSVSSDVLSTSTVSPCRGCNHGTRVCPVSR